MVVFVEPIFERRILAGVDGEEECEAIAMWVGESVEGCSGCDVDSCFWNTLKKRPTMPGGDKEFGSVMSCLH